VKTLTKTEEEGTIIINRPDRSTYPEEKSVLRSGATPGVSISVTQGTYRHHATRPPVANKHLVSRGVI